MAPPVRLTNVDVVRGFAILAMIVAHTSYLGAGTAWRPVSLAQWLLNDVASPLFALVMGISLGIMAAATGGPAGGSRRRFVRQMVIRAGVLIVLGLVLRVVPAGVAIVLDYLGIALLVSLLFVFLPTRWLVAVIALLFAVGPVLNGWGLSLFGLDPVFVDPSHPVRFLVDWTLTGPAYRATELVPLMLLGVVFARIGPANRRLAVATLGAGCILVPLAAVVRKFVDGGQLVSGSFTDLAWDAGLVFLAYGGITLLLSLDGARIRKATTAVSVPLRELGMMSLTVYVLHVGILGVLRTSLVVPPAFALLVTLALVMVCCVSAHLWLRFLGEGPVERLTGLLAGRRSWAQFASVRQHSQVPG